MIQDSFCRPSQFKLLNIIYRYVSFNLDWSCDLVYEQITIFIRHYIWRPINQSATSAMSKALLLRDDENFSINALWTENLGITA